MKKQELTDYSGLLYCMIMASHQFLLLLMGNPMYGNVSYMERVCIIITNYIIQLI